jgi:hypothetical protein
MKIYCVAPISGLAPADVFRYYNDTKAELTGLGYDVLIPMYGKGRRKTESTNFEAEGVTDFPLSTDHAIFTRDRWMVGMADVLFADLTGTTKVSIGSVMELAWGSMLNKHIVLVLPENNVHKHAFVLQAASVIYNNRADAVDYLRALAKKEL